MRPPISLLIVVALATCTLANNDCDGSAVCTGNAPEICIFHLDKYCFIKYKNVCEWNEVKCLYDLDYTEYALGYCDLENFACHSQGKKHKRRVRRI